MPRGPWHAPDVSDAEGSASEGPDDNDGSVHQDGPRAVLVDVDQVINGLVPDHFRRRPELLLLVAVGLVAYKHREKLVSVVGKLRGKKPPNAAAR